MMDTALLHADDTVALVLSRWPEITRAFIHLKTDCVGCPLMRFCSLRDVAEAYSLHLEQVMQALDPTVLPPNHSPSKENSNDEIAS